MANIDKKTIQAAIYNPGRFFKSPRDVLRKDLPLAEALSKEQKIELLERWVYDVKERAVAVDENMRPNAPEVDILSDILLVLEELQGFRYKKSPN
jgi:hypothetical protein